VVLPIVLVAVLPDQLHLLHEGRWLGVAVVQQPLLDRPQVHRAGDDGEVVEDVELHGVHWLHEVVGALQLAATTVHPQRRLLPAVGLDSGQLLLSDAVGAVQQLL
jgi:hypothetical protein